MWRGRYKDRNMTYKIDQFVRKISSPIKVVFGNTELIFDNGEALAGYVFDKPYLISKITAQNNTIVLNLAENALINETMWSETDQSYF